MTREMIIFAGRAGNIRRRHIYIMKNIRLISILAALVFGGMASVTSGAQERVQRPGGWMEYSVENGDTVFYDSIRPARVFQKMPKQKGREWRKYYRLVHNFSKAYPYALVAKRMVEETDSVIAADRLTGLKKERYINHLQKELFGVFEKQMRSLTVSQGMLIMKLIDRETGHTSYELIRGYKGGITAGFWQGVAKMFDEDMKRPYDPNGEDEQTEELVQLWWDGDFPSLYWSLFWTDPPVVEIPEKYRNWKPAEE